MQATEGGGVVGQARAGPVRGSLEPVQLSSWDRKQRDLLLHEARRDEAGTAHE